VASSVEENAGTLSTSKNFKRNMTRPKENAHHYDKEWYVVQILIY